MVLSEPIESVGGVLWIVYVETIGHGRSTEHERLGVLTWERGSNCIDVDCGMFGKVDYFGSHVLFDVPTDEGSILLGPDNLSGYASKAVHEIQEAYDEVD